MNALFDFELFLLHERQRALVKRERVALGAADELAATLAREGFAAAWDRQGTYASGERDDIGYRGDAGLVTVFAARERGVAERGVELWRVESRAQDNSPCRKLCWCARAR